MLCDLKCGNSWELIEGILHDKGVKGKVMQRKLPSKMKICHFPPETQTM